MQKVEEAKERKGEGMRSGSSEKKEGRGRKEEVVIEEQKEEKIIERMIQGDVENDDIPILLRLHTSTD